MLKSLFFLFLLPPFFHGALTSEESLVTIEKSIDYKRSFCGFTNFTAPETVIVCYQRTTMNYFSNHHPEIQESQEITNLYLLDGGKIGILKSWGMGAPMLAIKMEQLIYFGTKRFISIGTAGALLDSHQIADLVICDKALPEDGVAQHYLHPEQDIIEADPKVIFDWINFINQQSLLQFNLAMSWSFSAIYRETLTDILRVVEKGCSVVGVRA